MSTSIFGWSYPPGAANDPYAPYNQSFQPIDLTQELEAMGKIGHGLCGKDADLDYGGQIAVKGCFLYEEHIEIFLIVYATICPPADKDKAETYGEIVCTWNDYPGEWSGDDWYFWLENIQDGFKFRVPFKWSDKQSDKQNNNRALKAAYKAIFKHPDIKAFQENMTALAKAGENL